MIHAAYPPTESCLDHNSIYQLLEQYLTQYISQSDKLSALLHLLQLSINFTKNLDMIMMEIWAYISKSEIWSSIYRTLENTKEVVDYQKNVKPVIIRKRTNDDRK
jgi:hypothetical protein